MIYAVPYPKQAQISGNKVAIKRVSLNVISKIYIKSRKHNTLYYSDR